MEESDFLTDLLECSVCFEQLDIASKVLPCQHTFCKRCLEGIVVTHKELRCPECRVLVETRVNALPPNILLIRLLEGIKNNSRVTSQRAAAEGALKSPSVVVAAPQLNDVSTTNTAQEVLVARTATTHAKFQIPNSTDYGISRELLPNTNQPMMQSLFHQRNVSLTKHLLTSPNPPRAKALYSYDGKEDGDLSFKKGDTIILRKRIDPNWYHGELNGKQGFLPASYVQVLVPPPNSQPPQCKALYDFRVTDVEEKDCLSFCKSDVITVIRRVDDNWAEGKLADRIGIFPISFVEMNSSAKALMKLANLNSSGPSRTVPPTPGSTSSTTTSSLEATASTASQLPPPASATLPAVVSRAASGNNDDSTTSSPSSPSSPPGTPSSSSSSSSSLSLPLGLTQPGLTVTAGNVTPATSSYCATSSSHALQQQHSLQQSISAASVSKGYPSAIITTAVSQTNTSQAVYASGQQFMATSRPVMSTTSIKRHSLCAPSSTTFGVPFIVHQRSNSHHQQDSSPHRHSMEILNERTNSSTVAPDVVSCNWPSEFSRNAATRSSCRLETSLMGSRTSQLRSPPPAPAFYVAMFNYKPQKIDELELRKSEFYTVIEKCQDGWFKGTSLRSGASGVFPGNYVQLPKSLSPHANYGNCSSSSGGSGSASASLQGSALNCDQPIAPLRPKQNHQHHSARCESTNSSSVTTTPPPSSLSSNNTVYARPRPVTLATSSSQNTSVASSLLDWARSVAPPSRPPKSGLKSPPRESMSPTHSSSTASSPSPQWPPVRVAATRNAPPASSSFMTPPNISVKHVAPVNQSDNGHSKNGSSSDKKDFKEKKVSLMKRWTRKKSRSPPPTSNFYTHDNPSFEDTSPRQRGHLAMTNPGTSMQVIHVRSGSCPSEALTGGSRKENKQPAAPPLMRERYRCVVPYPPNSDYELELQLGDVVLVHKKREDGWLKGTLQKTGKTGLFPSSFVEAF